MRKLLVVLLMAIACSGNCQTREVKKEKPIRWDIGWPVHVHAFGYTVYLY